MVNWVVLSFSCVIYRNTSQMIHSLRAGMQEWCFAYSNHIFTSALIKNIITFDNFALSNIITRKTMRNEQKPIYHAWLSHPTSSKYCYFSYMNFSFGNPTWIFVFWVDIETMCKPWLLINLKWLCQCYLSWIFYVYVQWCPQDSSHLNIRINIGQYLAFTVNNNVRHLWEQHSMVAEKSLYFTYPQQLLFNQLPCCN